MKNWSIPIACLSSLILGTVGFGQQPPADNHLFSSDLVMWSYMQEPQPAPSQTRQTPTPDPSPETQPQQNPTTQPPQSRPPQTTPAAAGFPDTVQTFTGIISKEADDFILQSSTSTSYKLDNQQQVQQYEGQRVRVTGTLDSSVNLIHVEKVEPLT